MFNKILIANRGEIACRVMQTAHRLGIRTVAVFSDADIDALHVQMADEAVHIGGAAPADSYLRKDAIIAAAKKTGAQAVHPGYGFLSENASFCQLCAANDIVFIGPPEGAIHAMGSKSAAKQIMEQAGVPLLPGYHGADQNPILLKDAALDIGYPVLLKAVSGGGGKGMRQVHEPADFDDALAAARREAMSSFGDDDMLVEKYLAQPRHVEVQVFCDTLGNGVYLFERDCSVQRRHQKIIEEAPGPGIDPGLRKRLGEAALRAAAAVDYVGAGTVEFLLDSSGEFYFMEMNTRLQVEHPVTEMITGQDLVEWQLKVAYGEPLPCNQSDLKINGHAFEARIYAEDPDNGFLPAAGQLTRLQQPSMTEHVRIDTGVIQGDEVGVFYDPMIAKLIVWDTDRPGALRRLIRALADYRVVGVTTNIDFLRRLANHHAFMNETLSTDFITRHESELFANAAVDIEPTIALASLYLTLRRQGQPKPDHDRTSPWHALDYWRINAPSSHGETIETNGTEYVVTTRRLDPRSWCIAFGDYSCTAHGHLEGDVLYATINEHRQSVVVLQHEPRIDSPFTLFGENFSFEFRPKPPNLGEDVHHDDGSGFKAPMNGTVVDILVKPGDEVSAGDTLVIMEAMKMEHAIKAPLDGCISEIFYAKGDLVDGGVDLLAFTKAEQ